ncbi:hypothetical protein [Streptomyces sp. RTd22]|uniref:hypothetical protein n=1 Tax=Streptomyces sp. RTd22 TaxID=1841249 RepID=UPI00131DBC63|nr:hypothetical protein [Streptomyces sp. RTd22]
MGCTFGGQLSRGAELPQSRMAVGRGVGDDPARFPWQDEGARPKVVGNAEVARDRTGVCPEARRAELPKPATGRGAGSSVLAHAVVQDVSAQIGEGDAVLDEFLGRRNRCQVGLKESGAVTS